MKWDEVFQLAADFPNAAQFISGITKVELLTDGPIGVGTVFKETRKMFGKEAAEEMTVTVYDPPKRYALECESCGCHYHTEFLFTSENQGTDVTVTFEATSLNWFARLTSILFRPMMKMCMKAVEKDLDDLEAALERSATVKSSQGE